MGKDDVSKRLREKVARLARRHCEYCRTPEVYSPIPRHSVDHVVPVCDGGKTEGTNLALSCQGCNNFKSSKTEGRNRRTGQLVRLFHPRNDRWSDHFAWSSDLLIIDGLTDIGKVTVEVLQLNREGLVNLRRVLILVGAHPPSEVD
jgi:hypothetical protein